MFHIGRFSMGILVLSLVAQVTNATPITYAFTVTPWNGPLNGVSSTGTFTFDSSVIVAGGGIVDATGLLTGLSFNWNGRSYNATTANTGRLVFDSSGNLNEALFGTNCTVGSCSIGIPG